MKKIGKFIESNIKLVIGILIGGVLVGGSVYAATIIGASEVSYTNNSQSNVGGALDELYTKASKWLNPNDMGTPQYYAYGRYKGWCSSTDTNCNSYADFPTTATTPPSGKNVYAVKYEDEQYGVCIQRNGKEHCFRGRNYTAELKHVQDVFSDIGCDVTSSSVYCYASDFDCGVNSDGYVHCRDIGTLDFCGVNARGVVLCT